MQGIAEQMDETNQRSSNEPLDLTTLWGQAMTSSAEGDEDSAYGYFLRAVKIDPDDPVLHYNLGHSAQLLGKNKRAVEHYTKSIGIDGRYGDAYLMRAVAYDHLKKHKLAMEDCTKAIEINPSDAQAFNNRGISHRLLGDTRSALSDYNKSIRLDPTMARFYFNRAILFEQLRDRDRALADYESTISIDPTHKGANSAIKRLVASKR